ncbi:hypothetical protein [Tardiphaga sp.]|uniref:hypothetical protein n=1 Tax=Tardiphaga sp. TaxID=1926292 RepID=UPI00352BAFA0
MPNSEWLWAIDELERGDYPSVKKIAGQIKIQTEYGAREVVLPPSVALYVAGVLGKSIKQKVGRKKKVAVIKLRAVDIVLIEEVAELEKSLGSADAAFEHLAARDSVKFDAIKRRYYRARKREGERIPNRDRP